MKVKELFKKFISRGAIIYTAGSLFILLVSLAVSENSAAKILSPMPFLFFAAYSYIMSLGSTLYSSGAFSSAISRIIHALCFNIGFFCFVLLCGIEFAYAAIFTAIYAIIYAAVVIIAHIVSKKSGVRIKEPAKQREEKITKASKSKKEKSKAQNTYTNRFS